MQATPQTPPIDPEKAALEKKVQELEKQANAPEEVEEPEEEEKAEEPKENDKPTEDKPAEDSKPKEETPPISKKAINSLFNSEEKTKPSEPFTAIDIPIIKI